MSKSIVDRAFVGNCAVCGAELHANSRESIMPPTFYPWSFDRHYTCEKCKKLLCRKCVRRIGFLKPHYYCGECVGMK